jgi:hypothetical protein
MSLTITIEYKLIGATEWQLLSLSPDEYFDPDPDEPFDIDSVPKYDDAISYIESVSSCEVMATRLMIDNPPNETARTITTTFWNDARNRLVEVIDLRHNAVEWWELILSVQVTESPDVCEILRIGRESGLLKARMHSFIETLENGSQLDRVVSLPS